MRQIERDMVRAIKAEWNWHLNNTEVKQFREVLDGRTIQRYCKVYLHGNEIATVYYSDCDLSPYTFTKLDVNVGTLIDWPTPTTMSRLRALGAHVYQRKGEIYLDGERL